MTSDLSAVGVVASAIEDATEIAFACHVGPDGDALGSMLGLAIAASNRGKEVTASFANPFVVPPNLSFLPSDLLVAPEDFPAAPELMVVLDVGSAARIGDLAVNASAVGKVVVIDHHVTNEGFGDVALVHPEAAATGELVFEVLRHLAWEITPEIALCLHTALVTDTGRFQYSNTTATTLRIAAELVEAGADPSLIGRHVYDEAPFGYLKAASLSLARAKLDTDLRVLSATITHEDLAAHDIDWSDTENLIDLLRLAVEADTTILARGHADRRVKVSMRSRGETDVGGLAASMGGGGHRLAAGFTVDGEVDDVVARVVAAIEEYR